MTNSPNDTLISLLLDASNGLSLSDAVDALGVPKAYSTIDALIAQGTAHLRWCGDWTSGGPRVYLNRLAVLSAKTPRD